MIYLTCPYCGPRDVTEFRYGSDAHIARPKQPGALSDPEWADYLFMKDNPKGLMRERWMHAHGCRRWFNAVRNTVTDVVVAVYKIGEPPMVLDETVGRPATAESDARPELKVLPATASLVPASLVPTPLVPTPLVPTPLVPTPLVPTPLVPTPLVTANSNPGPDAAGPPPGSPPPGRPSGESAR